MNVQNVCRVLDEIAPLSLAAEWDNVGLLVGDGKSAVRKMLLCIDLTPAVLAEAGRVRAQMVMAYHPVIFKSVDRITAEASSVVYESVRRGIAAYSMHTALDAAAGGTNDVLADVLGLQDRRPLEPVFGDKKCKLVVFMPAEDLSTVANAAFDVGAGIINDYHDCSFLSHGIGTFCGQAGTHPTVGRANRHEVVEEVRLEIVAPRSKVPAVCQAVRHAHSYEAPAIDVYPLDDVAGQLGMGRVGRLGRPVKLQTLLGRIKKAMGVRHLQLAGDSNHKGARRLIGTAAVAAGSAGSMWQAAVRAGATLYLTGEMRHHDALAASAAGLCVVCAGHFHSERLTLENLAGRLAESAPALKTVVSQADRDPFDIV